MEKDPILIRLIQQCHYEIPNRDLEDRIMEKIIFAAGQQRVRRRNIRLSWIFLSLSGILLFILLTGLSDSFVVSLLTGLGIKLAHFTEVVMPAAILVSAILLLVQIDNLYRLTVKIQ